MCNARAHRLILSPVSFTSAARVTALIVILAVGLFSPPARVALAQDAVPTVTGDENGYVEASVDMPSPWLGQQITYIFRYYEAVDESQLPSWIRPPDYEAPEYSGFWVEGAPESEAWTETIDGRIFNIAELRTVLFPTSVGAVTIPPATLIIYDLFDGGERRLETLPVDVDVQPLPAGAPDGFQGAVGDFALSAQADRAATVVGEPILLRVTLTGNGNLRLVDAPDVRDIPGWRVLPRGSDALTEVVDGTARGTRTFDYVLIPGEAGTVTVPPLEIHFFEPTSGEYRVTQTQPLVLEALVDPANPAPQALLTSTVGSLPQDATPAMPEVDPVLAQSGEDAETLRLASGVHALELRPASGRIPQQQRPLTESPLFWALWLLPAAAIVVGVEAQRRTGRGARQARLDARRRAGAGRDMLRNLPPPASFGFPAEAIAAADAALLEFLERRLARPVKGMSLPALAALLEDAGASPDLATRVQTCLRQGEEARYSPLGLEWEGAARIHAEVIACIRDLDGVLQ